ncbi:hypothetical protein D3C75_705200 [compost metagenome]
MVVAAVGGCRADDAGQIAGEVAGIVVGLETDQVVVGECADQLQMVGQRGQQVGRRHGDMQEETDAVVVPLSTQGLRQGDQVVVVHPENVVRCEERTQALGKELVDPLVTTEIGLAELRQIDPVVQDRPQHPVGEAVVVLIEVARAHVGQDVLQVPTIDGRGWWRLIGHLPAPAKPEALALLHGGMHRHGKAPRRRASLLVGNRHPIGDHHESRHSPSSQLMDRRIALFINPAIE